MTSLVFLLTAAGALAALLLSPWSRSAQWQATVTPLASIIGSGFLVSAPLLAREFGGFAAPAMALLILVAGLIGWTLRYNIRVVEPLLAERTAPILQSLEGVSHIVLTFAYFVSIAYYLSLLGHFVLEAAGIQSDLTARLLAIALVLALGLLGWSGGAKKVASVERYAVALNLAAIAGFLAALAVFFVVTAGSGAPLLSLAGTFDLGSLPVLLGLLIVVQGFETSRFMGAEFDAPTRIRAMRHAQILSGIIYIAFFLLLSPLLGPLAEGDGVAAIITISALVAGLLPVALTVAAAGSQFSAAVADSIGNVGLLRDLTRNRIDARHAYALVAAIGAALLIAADVAEVIALASRAFALFYALQCAVAWEAARHRPEDRLKSYAFTGLGGIALLVCLFGAPAE